MDTLTEKAPTFAAAFAQLRPVRFGEPALYVPQYLADTLEAEAEAKRANEDERADADERERKRLERLEDDRRKKQQAAEATIHVGYHQAVPDECARHQVLVDIDAVCDRVLKLRMGAGNGDRDMAKRETKALEAALALGPDRSIVRPQNWQARLEELAQEMPSFRAPVDLVSQAFALSVRCGGLPAVPPMLLIGPPGVGKSLFAYRLSDVLRCGHAWLALDQRTAGTTLRGSDAHWSNARHGLLFQHLALGKTANPVFVLDEIDKAARAVGRDGVDMLSQLHSVLEPETSRHVEDISLGIELDASQVMYVATANDLQRLDAPLLSRFEVFQIGLPTPREQREASRRIVASVLVRLEAEDSIAVSEGAYVLLAQYSPRAIRRAAERALAICVSAGRARMSIEDVERALGIEPAAPAKSADSGGGTPVRRLH